MDTRNPWVVAGVGSFIVVALVVFVLLSAAVDVPSEISLPLIVLAALAIRSFRNRRRHVT